MTRRQKAPLRMLEDDEQQWLERISRLPTDPASHVARAKAIRAVAAGASSTQAAQTVGRRSNDAIAQLVARFNRDGSAAIVLRHSGGQPVKYSPLERQRILEHVQQQPDREVDGTATWSLATLRQALRTAPDGLPHVSSATIHSVLREAGWRWQRSRSWCKAAARTRWVRRVHPSPNSPQNNC